MFPASQRRSTSPLARLKRRSGGIFARPHPPEETHLAARPVRVKRDPRFGACRQVLGECRPLTPFSAEGHGDGEKTAAGLELHSDPGLMKTKDCFRLSSPLIVRYLPRRLKDSNRGLAPRGSRGEWTGRRLHGGASQRAPEIGAPEISGAGEALAT